MSTGFAAAVWAFDPAQIKNAATGVNYHDNRYINPTNLGNWHTQWPNLPANKLTEGDSTATTPRPIYTWPSGQTAFWDTTTTQTGRQELIWVNPDSYNSGFDYVPTFNVFVVNGSCQSP